MKGWPWNISGLVNRWDKQSEHSWSLTWQKYWRKHLRTSLLKNPWFGILGNDQKYFAANWRRETCKCLKMKLISAAYSRLLPGAQGLSAPCITKKIMLWIPDLILGWIFLMKLKLIHISHKQNNLHRLLWHNPQNLYPSTRRTSEDNC